MKNINLKISILLLFFGQNFYSQAKFEYKNIPKQFDFFLEYHNQETNFQNVYFAKLNQDSNDHTTELQSIIDEHNKIVLPNYPLYINKKGISLKSNTTLIGQKSTELIMISNDEIDFAVLNVHRVHNVVIKGVHIVGDREKREGEIKGEWGHGVSIKGSTSVYLIGLKIEKTIGDGVYIGQQEGIPSENVYVRNTVIDNVRRNGLSITSGQNIFIKKLLISNSSGTKPMYGLDIEPNSNRDFIENIVIDSVTTFNNAIGGLKININKLAKGKVDKRVAIKVSHFQDFYSPTGLRIGNVTINPEKISGHIDLIDLKFYYNRTPFQVKSSQAKKLTISLSNVKWIEPLRKAFTKKEVRKNYKKRTDVNLKL